MNKVTKVIVIVALIAAVGVVIAVKQNGTGNTSEAELNGNTNTSEPVAKNEPNSTDSASETSEQASLPLLLDLGSHKCVPCKMMEPILEEFKNDYSDEFKTRFIDVRENRTAARKYNIRVIPTQIFFDANGTELFRHEGFYSKEDMLDKWGELGVEIDKAPNDKAD
jgi:thioredoxin 1